VDALLAAALSPLAAAAPLAPGDNPARLQEQSRAAGNDDPCNASQQAAPGYRGRQGTGEIVEANIVHPALLCGPRIGVGFHCCSVIPFSQCSNLREHPLKRTKMRQWRLP
jgi:hypothetical protein